MTVRPKHPSPKRARPSRGDHHQSFQSQSRCLQPRATPSAGTIAAQFVFLDELWYALKDVSIGNLQKKLTGLLYSPARTDIEDAGTYLRQHTILDSTSEVDPISYIYTVETPAEGSGQIKIGENTEFFEGPVGEVIELVSWDFEGTIEEAIHQMER